MENFFDAEIKSATAMWLPGRDWRLLKAQYIAESNLNPEALSPAGARGIAQFMPATWDQWSARAGYQGVSPEDPQASIYTGAAYMAHLIGVWNSPRPDADRQCLAMASYNAGLGHILKAQKVSGGKLGYSEIIAELPAVTGRHSTETIGYVARIYRLYTEILTTPIY